MRGQLRRDVITGVAEKVAGLLKRLVYIDAMVPDGESAWDVMSAHLPATMLNAIQQTVATGRWLALAWRLLRQRSPWPEVTAQPFNQLNALHLRDPLAAALPCS